MLISFECLYKLLLLNLSVYSLRLFFRKLIEHTEFLLFIEEFIYSCEVCALMILIAPQTKGFSLHLLSGLSYCLSLWWSHVTSNSYILTMNYLEKFIFGEAENMSFVFGMVMGQFLIGHYDWLFKLVVYAFMECVYDIRADSEERDSAICKSELKVTVLEGFLLEAILHLIERINVYLAKHYWICRNLLWQTVLNILIIFTAIHVAGFVFHPTVATAIQFECADASTSDFFIIYWFGTLFGYVLAHCVYISLFRRVQIMRKPLSPSLLSTSDSWSE